MREEWKGEEWKKWRMGFEKKGGCLVCLATGADPVIRERLGIVVAAAPRPLYGAMDGAHKGWMAPTMNRGCPQSREMAHERGNPRKKIPTKEDTNERGYPRVVKCQFFYTEQNLQTKFYPKKNV